jgi:nitroimidazol reductase NimA-like FMN-containing flavoprotein (pyridoxamine 5'-phosphate oxidase superfamily)
VELDRSGLEVLPREDCLRLLASVRIGRIGFSAAALPVILPVAFALDQQGIVVRVHAGSQLHAGTRNAVVAFEVDDGNRSEARWSVAVTGVATELVDPAEVERARRLPLDDWSSSATDHFVRITLDLVSGRRNRADALAGASRQPQGRTA